MKDNRKDLRLRLPESSGSDFQAAKAKAERELGYTLRDNEFAVRVLVQSLRQWDHLLPELCRERLRIEGRAYPVSGCDYCGNGWINGCPHKTY